MFYYVRSVSQTKYESVAKAGMFLKKGLQLVKKLFLLQQF